MSTTTLFLPAIEKILKAYAVNPKGSLLICGPLESDLKSVVLYLIQQIYPQKTSYSGYIYDLKEKSPQAIRDLLNVLTKTRFHTDQPRLIIVKDCELLTLIAQNTLLKALEEPPLGSHFILTTCQPQGVLPTISSRCQIIKMRPPLKQDLFAAWPKKDDLSLQQAYWATDGWPQSMTDYLNNDTNPLNEQINLAKEFLSFDLSQRTKYLFDKTSPQNSSDFFNFLQALLAGLRRICRAALLTTALKNEKDKMILWQKKLTTVNELNLYLERKINPKIIALYLSLNL